MQKLHILPSVLDAMSQKEKAIVYASIQVKVEDDKEEMRKIKAKGGKR